ncbi:hypothetical protein [Streptomyces sp. ICC4]|uniref:hypothetical protein n=1 Tax=Streptomyces sp. ICC4 TaxID=2099584 RepID=UPI0019550537|nr:hypothetical protein [Streptomyces sp. ICC4]
MSLVVFESMKQTHCAECRQGPLRHLVRAAGVPRCLDRADPGHLVYRPRGDTSLPPRPHEPRCPRMHFTRKGGRGHTARAHRAAVTRSAAAAAPAHPHVTLSLGV